MVDESGGSGGGACVTTHTGSLSNIVQNPNHEVETMSEDVKLKILTECDECAKFHTMCAECDFKYVQCAQAKNSQPGASSNEAKAVTKARKLCKPKFQLANIEGGEVFTENGFQGEEGPRG